MLLHYTSSLARAFIISTGVILSVEEVMKTVTESDGFVRLAYLLSQEVNRDVTFDVVNIDITATGDDIGSGELN